MSRPMKSTEVDAFERKYKYKPTAFPVAIDALAVYVNKDNPIKGMTMPQVDAVFSKSRRWGYKENIQRWGQLGLTADWANAPISLYGRNSASGTYGFFKEHALKNGDYKDEVKEQPGCPPRPLKRNSRSLSNDTLVAVPNDPGPGDHADPAVHRSTGCPPACPNTGRLPRRVLYQSRRHRHHSQHPGHLVVSRQGSRAAVFFGDGEADWTVYRFPVRCLSPSRRGWLGGAAGDRLHSLPDSHRVLQSAFRSCGA